MTEEMVGAGDPVPPVGIECVVAPNPGPMTLDGTNTYVIHDGARVWVVDPGPRSAAHLSAVLDATGVAHGAQPRGVIVTHHHADHAEAAGTLARQLTNRSRGDVPVWAVDPALVPGASPVPAVLEDEDGIVAHVLHLPGHTSDSIALLVSGGRLLSGDTILAGSSTAIVAPDGDVGEHLQSLTILRAMAADGRIAEVLPGHGPSLTSPAEAHARLDEAIASRRERIEQVRTARARGALTMPRLLREVYGPDLDPALREAAEGNLRAMMEYIAQQD